MDINYKLIKKNIEDGMKPGCLKNKLNLVSENFRTNINCVKGLKVENQWPKKNDSSSSIGAFQSFSSAIITPQNMKSTSVSKGNEYVGSIN